MSKSSELDKTVKAYIISCIDGSGYGESPETDADKVKFLRNTFLSEYGWQVERVGITSALREWFAGLPSSCSVAFMNHEIIALAQVWGSLPAGSTERDQDKILNNWWNLLANKTDQLFRKYEG